MSSTRTRPAAVLAVLAFLAVGCGAASATGHAQAPRHTPPAPRPAATRPAAPSTAHPPARTPAAPKTPAVTANPIPQGNSGDQDADNNGGPSDGDGNI